MRLRRGGKNTQKNYTKKDLNDPDNYNGVLWKRTDSLEKTLITARHPGIQSQLGLRKHHYEHHYEPSGGDGIPVELFQILKMML